MESEGWGDAPPETEPSELGRYSYCRAYDCGKRGWAFWVRLSGHAYTVVPDERDPSCSCPAFHHRKDPLQPCKHLRYIREQLELEEAYSD